MGGMRSSALPLMALACAVVHVGAAKADVTEPAILRSTPALVRLSYEALDLGASETMGLAGVHYLVNIRPAWYVGASGFGAVQGERGGFFTGGFTVGTGKRFASEWLLDAGLFVGGGGGGSAPQGGGLMLRPHLNVSRDMGRVMVGAGVSYVKFPNGGIESAQFGVNLGIPFDMYYGHARDVGKAVAQQDLFGLAVLRSEWIATFGEYQPHGDVETTTAAPMGASLERVGFEYRRFIDSHRYFFVETAGAMGGQSDGFAELLGGMGYRLPLGRGLDLVASLATGGAGGGQVDTGGGLVGKARVGLDYGLTPSLKVGVEAGRIESAGSFGGRFYGLSLGYRVGEVAAGEPGQQAAGINEVRLERWRLVGVQQTVFAATRKTGGDKDLGLLGLKLEKLLTDNFYVTGQAHGAFAGDAGGYATGLIGAGWEIPLRADGRLRFNMELAAGASGGGGVDVGGGSIIQPQLGLTWQAGSQIGLRVEVGKVVSPEGKLDSSVLGIGMTYEFSRPERSYR